ncbi:TCR-alpha V segment I-11 according to annotation by Tatsuya Ota [Triplophysa rosa]|nr:TCR-alpha V segment I-11 according to annotation by Tatsuya Ota [Triplophysa rosa]
MILCALLLLFLIKSDTFAQSITSLQKKTFASEGEKVSVSCEYGGAVDNLHWYLQFPRSKPEFLLWIYPHGTTKCRGEEKVDQPDKQITESEGGSVTLHCKYKTASSQPDLFWYIQRVNDFPKDILRRSKYGGDNGSEFQERFQSEVKSDSVPLIIQDVCGHMRTEVSSSISSCREVTEETFSPLQTSYRYTHTYLLSHTVLEYTYTTTMK